MAAQRGQYGSSKEWTFDTFKRAPYMGPRVNGAQIANTASRLLSLMRFPADGQESLVRRTHRGNFQFAPHVADIVGINEIIPKHPNDLEDGQSLATVSDTLGGLVDYVGDGSISPENLVYIIRERIEHRNRYSAVGETAPLEELADNVVPIRHKFAGEVALQAAVAVQ